MIKPVRCFFLLTLATLITITVTLIYFMGRGSEEMDTVIELHFQRGEEVRSIAGVQDRLTPDLPSHPPPSTASHPPPSTQPPPSTASHRPPSTASHPPPSTASHPPPSTASHPPPSTASHPPSSTASHPPPSTASHSQPSTASQPPPITASPSTTAKGTPPILNPWKDLIGKSETFKLISPLPDKHRPHPLTRPLNFKPEPHRRSKAGPTFNKDGEPVYPRFPAPRPADFDDVQFEDGEIDNKRKATDHVGLVLAAQKLYQRTLEQYLDRLKQNQIIRNR